MRSSFHVPVTGSRGRAPRELVSHNLANSLSASDGLGAGNPGDSCGSQSRQHPAIAQNKVVFYRFSSTMQHMHRGAGSLALAACAYCLSTKCIGTRWHRTRPTVTGCRPCLHVSLFSSCAESLPLDLATLAYGQLLLTGAARCTLCCWGLPYVL